MLLLEFGVCCSLQRASRKYSTKIDQYSRHFTTLERSFGSGQKEDWNNNKNMSGRLIILPKKSYCPWNSSNVERVLRDERESAETQAREKSRQEQESSSVRLAALQKRQTTASRSSKEATVSAVNRSRSERERDAQDAQHVNLFAVEEEAHRRQVEQAGDIGSTRRGNKNGNCGIMPLYLGQSAQSDSFYLKSGDSTAKDHDKVPNNPKDARLKSRMDPMKDFCGGQAPSPRAIKEPSKESITTKPPSSRRRYKHRKSCSSSSDSSSSKNTTSEEHADSRRQHGKRSSSSSKKGSRERKKPKTDSSSKNSLEELRRRRAEREEKERTRQEIVIATSEGHNNNRSRYQNQYHPRLSRN